MKFSWGRLLLFIGLSVLIFFHAFIGLYVYANIANWKISYFNINPPEPTNQRKFTSITYPPTESSGIHIENSNNIIIFDWSMEYNGTLAEGIPAKIMVWGTLSSSFAQKINHVEFYFRGAMPYPMNYTQYVGSGGVSLYPTTEHPPHFYIVSLGVYLANSATICWQAQGDYYPSIDIRFNNFTTKTQDYMDYSDYLIHVVGKDVIDQQTSIRVNTSISIALVFFGFVDGTILIARFLHGRRETNNKGYQKPSNKTTTKPKGSKPSSEKLRNKPSSDKHGKKKR